jgi:hypothetical protein
MLQLKEGDGVLNARCAPEMEFRALAHRYQAAAWKAVDSSFVRRSESAASDVFADVAAIKRWNENVARLAWWNERSGGVWAWSERAASAATVAQVACVLCTMQKALTPHVAEVKKGTT